MFAMDGKARRKDRCKITWSNRETNVFLEYIKANGPENFCVSTYLPAYHKMLLIYTWSKNPPIDDVLRAG